MKSWKRNTAGLKHNAEHKRQQTMAKAEEGIRQLLRENKAVNFESVAEVAGVSRAWIYREPGLKARILHLRDQSPPKTSLPPQLQASDSSKDAMMAALRQQIARLRTDNDDLRRQNEVIYGRLQELQDPGSGSEELERLRQENQQLRKQNQELTGKTSALEEMERKIQDLMKQKQALVNEIMLLKEAGPPPTKIKSRSKSQVDKVHPL